MILPTITSAIRTSYPYILSFGRNVGLCKVQTPCNFGTSQIAFITGKAMRADRPPRPPPFDWRNHQYKWWHVFTDPMEKRFDDNSKIVVIEGSPAVGKDKFARKLADELEMLYMPPPRFDDLFISPYGFDYRSVNNELPINAQFFDEKMFLADPYHINTAVMQHTYYLMRYGQYIDALTHVLSTGQGVVLQRSPWSDIVFMKTMHSAGYVSNGGFDYYKSSLAASLHSLLRPHLVIYLDIPSSIVKQKIEERALPHEINSPVLTQKYLDEIESNYKNIHLPEISEHANLLIYNWIEEGDILAIVDDIEELRFEDYHREDSKMEDWKFQTFDMRRAARSRYANQKHILLYEAVVARFDVPEMIRSGEDNSQLQKVLDKLADEVEGHAYAPGFNPGLDKGILWKTKGYWSDYERRSQTQPKVVDK